MKKNITGTAGILLVCATLLSAGCAQTATVKEDIPLVRSQVITTGAAGQSASYSGEVRGRYETKLAFQVSGKISKRNVDVGSIVHPGDVLMQIDAKDIRQTVNISSAQVASAQSQLSLAEANLQRYRQLYEQGAVSSMQLDQYQNAYQVALAAANQASAQYAQGANQLDYSSLIADSAGVVAAINAESGQVVSAGQAVITLVQDGEREIEINVPENRVDELKNANQLRVTFWALPGVSAAGSVREVSPVAETVTRTYKVRISLVNPPEALKLGMTANVALGTGTGGQAASIPLAAIYQTGNTPNVWVIQDGIAHLRPVKVGAFGKEQVQVVEGLQKGDVIVTAGVQKLHDGQKVRL